MSLGPVASSIGLAKKLGLVGLRDFALSATTPGPGGCG